MHMFLLMIEAEKAHLLTVMLKNVSATFLHKSPFSVIIKSYFYYKTLFLFIYGYRYKNANFFTL